MGKKIVSINDKLNEFCGVCDKAGKNSECQNELINLIKEAQSDRGFFINEVSFKDYVMDLVTYKFLFRLKKESGIGKEIKKFIVDLSNLLYGEQSKFINFEVLIIDKSKVEIKVDDKLTESFFNTIITLNN